MLGLLGNLISNVALLIIYAALMMLISFSLTVISLVFIAVVFAVQRYISSGPIKNAGET